MRLERSQLVGNQTKLGMLLQSLVPRSADDVQEKLVPQIMRKADLVRKNMVRSVRNERNILAMTNNPFVVSFYYSFTNATNLYIVMEYCNGGDCCNLLKGLGCMDEQVARLYIAETILALEYCHTKVGCPRQCLACLQTSSR